MNFLIQKSHKLLIYICWVFLVLKYFLSCSQPIKTAGDLQTTSVLKKSPLLTEQRNQIGEYITEIFEDSKGILWFGTIEYGLYRYDRQTLHHFTQEDGLPGNTIISIVEDRNGILWIGTRTGLSKYDGNSFTNYGWNEGLVHGQISTLLLDNEGLLWIGSWGGVCTYDGKTFSTFELPKPDIKIPYYQETANWVTDIIQDRKGNIWFGRSGLGLTMYDGKVFTSYTKKEGLLSNCVQAILEDKMGHLWIGTRIAEKDHRDPTQREGEGGLTRFDGKTFHLFPKTKSLNQNDIYALYLDSKDNIWIGANGLGLYKYDGESFHLYDEIDRMDLTPQIGIQNILEDRNGTMWLGFSGGLFKLDGTRVVNVTKEDLRE